MAGLGETPAPHLRQATLICGLCICIYLQYIYIPLYLSVSLIRSPSVCLLVCLAYIIQAEMQPPAARDALEQSERLAKMIHVWN